MRPYEDWTEDELREEYQRLSYEASKWHAIAVEANNTGTEQGRLYYHAYKKNEVEPRWDQAGAIVKEMRLYRGFKTFPNEASDT